jgi:hypothetical protein
VSIIKNEDGALIIGIYVDDYLEIGKQGQMKELSVELKECGFTLKIKNNLTDYLGFQLIENNKPSKCGYINHIGLALAMK